MSSMPSCPSCATLAFLSLLALPVLSVSAIARTDLEPSQLVHKAHWQAKAIPNPTKLPEQCGLDAPGRLCDPDLLLTQEERAKVQNVLVAISEKTEVKCPQGARGYQAAVLVVKSIAQEEWIGSDKERTAERFATTVGDAWGVGDAGCDNGVLLFVNMDDRMFYLKTAATTRKVLSDSTASIILDNMKELLSEGRTGDAILQGCLEIFDALQGKEVVAKATEAGLDLGGWQFWLVVFLIVAFMNLQVCVGICGFASVSLMACILLPFAKCLDCTIACCGRRKGRSKEADEDLQRVQQELQRDEFEQTMCPICLDSLQPVGAEGEVQTLHCRHGFHKSCIGPWIESHGSCPLCRADVRDDVALADEDKNKSDRYQRRLRFYLSRLQVRHPDAFAASRYDSRRPAYYVSDTGYWLYRSPTPVATGYADALNAHYQSATSGAQSLIRTGMQSSGGSSSGGSSGSSFGGGGFSGGGGAGGGW